MRVTQVALAVKHLVFHPQEDCNGLMIGIPDAGQSVPTAVVRGRITAGSSSLSQESCTENTLRTNTLLPRPKIHKFGLLASMVSKGVRALGATTVLTGLVIALIHYQQHTERQVRAQRFS